jgi:predicted RNA-binding Zn ribbon-like protein
MIYTNTDPDVFDQNAGEICLAFTNTADWHASEHPEEYLNSYADLVLWALTLEVIEAEEAQHLWQQGQSRPQQAEDLLAQAIELREAIYRIFTGILAGEVADSRDLETLNGAIRRALTHRQLVVDGDKFQWEWEPAIDALDTMLWPVAISAGDLLISGPLDRIGQCADDRGCGWLFLDTSRNHSRRWCSMESCGNRAKAMRHYQQGAKGVRGIR